MIRLKKKVATRAWAKAVPKLTRCSPAALCQCSIHARAPLAAVVFLTGFGAAARVRAITPGKVDVGRLQPVGSSMVNAPPARRVIEMARLLARSRVYELSPGAPDETAAVLEETVCAA